MSKPKLEYRMYGLVPYNISPIQQGIQFGHAVVEFALEYGTDEIYKKWAKEDKTFIILNGGTTNTRKSYRGTLNNHLDTLILDFRLPLGFFNEPDLGDQLTAVVFLIDERVYDKKKYPSPEEEEEIEDYPSDLPPHQSIENLRRIQNMGGQYNWELRQFLDQFRLA